MSSSRPLARRTFLRGAGVAMSLPLLEGMFGSSTAHGANGSAGVPPRLCYLYFPNGVAEGAWQPAEVGDSGQLRRLNRWMAPLQPFAEDLVIPRRVWTPRGNGHSAGTATWLTGHHYDGRSIDAGSASVDQIAARHLQGQTLLPSLELSLRGEGFFSNSLPRNTLSWSSRAIPLPRETNPRVVFDRMFRVGTGVLSDKSVLDAVLNDARSLKRRVGSSDQRKLDEYLESVRAIERRMEFASRQTNRADSDPELKRGLVRPPAGIPDDHEEYLRLMLDMIVLAFWADATRVSTFMLDHGQSNRYFNFIEGVRGTWHALSHWKDASGETEDDDGKTSWSSTREKRDMYNMVTRWHHEQVAYFLGRLKAIREANGGTLLDNSMIVYGSSLADGHEHSAKNLPILLAGHGGGTIKTGQRLRFRRDTSMSRLHLSLLQRLHPQIERFGETKEPMSELDL